MAAGRFRGRTIALALSAAWLIGTTVLFEHQRTVEVHRLARQCHGLQADARSTEACADPGSGATQPLCRYKDADCDYWPLEDERLARNVAMFAVTPLILAWAAGYVVTRLPRWRRNARDAASPDARAPSGEP